MTWSPAGPRSLRPCPPGPKGVGYLTPGCLATAVPGRGVGVWPEAALTREWRHGGRRLQGDVGFREGRPRRARLLRQREARALGGTRAATVRAEEKSISRGGRQHCWSLGRGPGPPNSHPSPGWSSTSRANPAWPTRPSSTEPRPVHWSPIFSEALSLLSPHHLGHTPPPYLRFLQLSSL